MNADRRIAAYVDAVHRRTTWLRRTRIVSVGALAVALFVVGFAVVAAYMVPTSSAVFIGRAVLAALAVVTLVAGFWLAADARESVRRVERRVPAFAGRLATWFDAVRRKTRPALLSLLESEAVSVADAHPPGRALPTRAFAVPGTLIAASLGLLAWFLSSAPEHMRLPAERLVLGDTFADTRPRITVVPGDAVVARGADVLVRAEAQGFATGTLRLHAAFAGAPDWEAVEMLPGAGPRHEFVLVAVTEPVDYYVTAGSVRSDRYRIDVADLPTVTGVDLVLEYPAWTHLAPRRQDDGDVAAVAGTAVAVTVHSDLPLANARLVVDDRNVQLGDGNTGKFVVEATGTWHVAAEHRGRFVRISESFLIDALADRPPEVEFAFPGRDRSASSIEEVALRFRARDDFGVEALAVHFAVNGGDWSVLDAGLEAPERYALSRHLLALEALETPDGRAIRPGDVVSFFAEARDHRQAVRSALYFVDVRPFDKRYRQRAGDGGSGAGGGEGGLELSSRQREIAAATWNLIRDRDSGTRVGTDLDDQIDVLAILQSTLGEQVETMIARAEGRRLSIDEGSGRFRPRAQERRRCDGPRRGKVGRARSPCRRRSGAKGVAAPFDRRGKPARRRRDADAQRFPGRCGQPLSFGASRSGTGPGEEPLRNPGVAAIRRGFGGR